jgi:CMP-N-acetylneuraminic acid synthetase
MRLCNGKPLVYHTIKAALESELLGDIFLTTDSPEIKSFTESMGVKVIDRPPELSRGEDGSMVGTVQHAVMAESLDACDAVCLLQPVCPMRSALLIDGAIELLDNECTSVVSFVSVEGMHPYRMRMIDQFGYAHKLQGFEGEHPAARRQHLPPIYIRSGDIYLTKMDVIFAGQFEGDRCKAIMVDPLDTINIDDEHDFARAEDMLNERDKRLLKAEEACGKQFMPSNTPQDWPSNQA